MNENGSKQAPSWFEEWFNHDYYVKVYSHRSSGDAHNVIDLLLEALPLQTGAKILDLCCGSGRHSRALAERGFTVTGIDLSENLLEIARQNSEDLSIEFYQRDMRTSYPGAPYDCIANFFTSFGYFEKEEDNLLVLHKVREALKPEGFFFFDYLNADEVRRTLVPEDEKTLQGITVIQQRRIDEHYVYKHIIISDKSGQEYMFNERVRLYTLDHFERMFRQAGLCITQVYGDYTGAPFSPTSDRLILIASVQ